MARSMYALGFAAFCIFACDSHPTSPARTGDQASLTRSRTAVAHEVSADSKIVSFETMYGVDDAFINHKQIRGVLGDELPWDVGSATGSLTVGGHLMASVRGIVFKNEPSVPAELRGINDEEEFRALVSCLVPEKNNVKTVNIMTAGFPATRSGDSDIDTNIELPSDCIAPIIFIMSGSEDKWFSVMGAETGEG